MKLTKTQARAIQIQFWVAALRSGYDQMDLYGWTMRLHKPKLNKRTANAHLLAIAKEGGIVGGAIRAAIPEDLIDEVMDKYSKSIQEKP